MDKAFRSKMGKYLFYTFLGIFIATAVLALASLPTGGIKIDENYRQVLFGSLILEVIGVMISFFKLYLKPTGNIQVVSKKDPGIWEGFVNHYYAYNAPWKIEFTQRGKMEKFVEIHRKRYKNPRLEATDYLYFCDDDFFNDPNSESWQYFDRFVRFEAMVFYEFRQSEIYREDFIDKLKSKLQEATAPDNLSKLGVYLCQGPVPSMTYFVGDKKDKNTVKPTALLYMGSEPKAYDPRQKGNPDKIFLVEDEEFCEYLHDEYTNSTCTTLDERPDYYKGKQIFNKYIEIMENRKNQNAP